MRKPDFLSVLVLLLGMIGHITATLAHEVDATSIRDKVLCGYQGWFRCPGDGSGLGWIHWSWHNQVITPSTLTFEMWPDMSDYSQDERYKAEGFTYPNGEQAHLYSSHNSRTVLRHFEWMEDYGIDGVWLQRFLVDLPGGPNSERYSSNLQVLHNVQNATTQTGRVWALAYDMASMPTADIVQVMTSDWKYVVDSGINEDPRYLHHNGKPVLALWEFNRLHRPNVTVTVARQLIHFFKNDPNYSAFLVGGCENSWRSVEDEDWAAIFRSFDVICPWNVGNTLTENGKKWANTNFWKKDIKEATDAGMLYLPVVYPGFSWDNLQNLAPGTSLIPRQGGQFYWRQFYDAATLGCDMVYVAMFDEVDEGTAIFKVTNQPPDQGHFVTYDGFPSDWYMRLTAAGTRMLLGEREVTPLIPFGYVNPEGSVENLSTGKRYDYIQHAILDANDGDVVVVAPGTYVENIVFGGKNLTVRSREPNDPTVVAGTIIDGAGQGSVVTFSGGEDENCTLAGLTISNGYAPKGGGIYSDSSGLTLIHCVIVGNTAVGDGGGLLSHNSDLTLKNCIFRENTAGDAGGGMKNEFCSPTLSNCLFIGNTAVWGGGIYNHNQSNPRLVNCTFSRNSADQGGGAMRNFKSTPTLTNCIVWDNAPDSFRNRQASPSVSYSDIQQSHPGPGNINQDPCFVDAGSEEPTSWQPTAGTVSFWTFNEGRGTTTSDTVSSNHGTIHEAVWTRGKVGSALSFNGNGDYVDCGNHTSLNIEDEITIEAWIFPQSNHLGGIVSKGDNVAGHDDYALWFNNGKIEISFNWPEQWERFQSHASIPFNVWSHVAGTWDGYKVRLYLNGKLDSESDWTYGITNSSATFHIGVNPGGGREYFNGKIDEVMICSEALSPEVIQHHYENGLIELGDYHLLSNSPCINTGDPNYIPESNETDLDGRPRVLDGRIDMGVYEF